MSRIGKAAITIPSGVTVKISDGNHVSVKGSKGELSKTFHPDMKISMDNGVVKVERATDSKEERALHGLTRTLLNNMIVGVSTGYTKQLDLVGTGYKIVPKGK